jgi:hypothetical protein
VISLKFLNRHGIYWDNRSNTLVYGDEREHWADTPILFDQWVLEYQEVTKSEGQLAELYASFKAHSTHKPRPQNVATFDQWHEIIGHLYPEALRHLKSQY